MKIKIPKKKKGMTLVEVLIALAVFTIASSLLVTCCMWVNKCTLNTNSLLKNISYQSPKADNMKDETDGDVTLNDSAYQLKFKSTSSASLVKTVVVKQYIVNKATDNTDAVGRFQFFVYEPSSTSSS